MTGKPDFTKAQRRELSRIAGLAYERELATALTELEEQFRLWRAGEIAPADLNDAIHRFHQGPSRELRARYLDGPVQFAALTALHRGIVNASEAAPDVVAYLKPALESE